MGIPLLSPGLGDTVASDAWSHRAPTFTDTVSWDDITAPGPYGTLVSGSTTNGPSPLLGYQYYYVTVYSYGVEQNLTQVAVPYHADSASISYRSRYNGTWTPWHYSGSRKANLTFNTDWGNYSAPFGGCCVTKQGGIVVMEGLAQRLNSGLAMTGGQHYVVAYVPVTFRPERQILGCSSYCGSLGTNAATRMDIYTTGEVTICPPANFTFTAGQWFSLTASWRAA